MCNPEPTTLAEYCEQSVAASVMQSAVSMPGWTEEETRYATPPHPLFGNLLDGSQTVETSAQVQTEIEDIEITRPPFAKVGTRKVRYSQPRPMKPRQIDVGDDETETADSPAKSSNPKDVASVGKCPVHLVPPVLIRSTADALKNGADKYGVYNWRTEPVQYTNYLAAIMRHTLEVLDGEDFDGQSGLEHIAHIAATCGIILDAADHGTLIDDRPGK